MGKFENIVEVKKMSFKIIVQLGLASILFILSTGATWYEGSAIIESPWEWKHTAIFSEIVNGQVNNASDILPIDHFVYAAKFLPVFPLLMLLSGTYFIILIGYMLLKRNYKMFSYFLACIGILSLVLSGFVSNSPTSGLKIISNSFLFIGILLLAITLVRLVTNRTKKV